MVHECAQAVRAVLAELPRPEHKALAAAVSGVVLAEQAQRSRLSAASPRPARDRSKPRRVQRVLATPRLELPRAQRRLVAHILHRRQARLDLLLDATTTGATAQLAGTVTLCCALAWHHRALPVCWRTWTADAPGQHWTDALAERAQVIQTALPTDGRVQVVVLADRGLSGSTLVRLCAEHGWHYLLRVTRRTRRRRRRRLPDGTVRAVGTLVTHAGSRCCLTRVQLDAPRRKRGSGAGGWVPVAG